MPNLTGYLHLLLLATDDLGQAARVACEGQITMLSEYEEAPGIACNLRILGAYEPGETGPALLTEMLVRSRYTHLLKR